MSMSDEEESEPRRNNPWPLRVFLLGAVLIAALAFWQYQKQPARPDMQDIASSAAATAPLADPATAPPDTTVEPIAPLETAAPARSLAGMPMAYDLQGRAPNLMLADYIAESLRADPAGNGLIRGTPCTTPRNYLDAIKRMHPNAPIDSVDQLPAFFRSLIARPARANGLTGRYAMSWMRCASAGATTSSDVLVTDDAAARAFRADEVVYYHPNMDEPILAGDCKNIVGRLLDEAPRAQIIEPDCAIIMAPVIPGQDVARVAVSVRSGERVPSTCWAQQVGGEWLAWPGACDDCSWAEAHSAVPDWRERRLMEPGTWVATERFMVLRVPRVVADRGYVGFCIERRGHRGHSNTIWVEPGDWHRPEYRYTVQTPWTWID